MSDANADLELRLEAAVAELDAMHTRLHRCLASISEYPPHGVRLDCSACEARFADGRQLDD